MKIDRKLLNTIDNIMIARGVYKISDGKHRHHPAVGKDRYTVGGQISDHVFPPVYSYT